MEHHTIPVVREFSDVFPKDVTSLPLEREVEFYIYLVLRLSSVSIASYEISSIELKGLNAQ